MSLEMENREKEMEEMQNMTNMINDDALEKVAGGSGKSISDWDKACSHFICTRCLGQGREVSCHQEGCESPQIYSDGVTNCCGHCMYNDHAGHCIYGRA